MQKQNDLACPAPAHCVPSLRVLAAPIYFPPGPFAVSRAGNVESKISNTDRGVHSTRGHAGTRGAFQSQPVSISPDT